MKTIVGTKFNKTVKEGFHEVLKPLGFKKKGNNFYLPLDGLGQIINIQKSIYYSKEHIHFTINTGIFLPEYWLASYNFHYKELPVFPTESVCVLRRRIGELRNQGDTWYDIVENTDEVSLISEMKENILMYILPYFNKVKTKESFICMIDSGELRLSLFVKLIIYGELKYFDKAKMTYEEILSERIDPHFLHIVKEYGQKYRLE